LSDDNIKLSNYVIDIHGVVTKWRESLWGKIQEGEKRYFWKLTKWI